MLLESTDEAEAAQDSRPRLEIQDLRRKRQIRAAWDMRLGLPPESPRASRTTREVSASALREPAMFSRPCSSRGGALYSSRHTPQRYARSAHAST